MKTALDGKKILTEEQFHQQIKNALEFPDHYGENLDALWDCLTGYIELPTTLLWNDFEISRSADTEHSYIDIIVSQFSDPYLVKRGFEVIYK